MKTLVGLKCSLLCRRTEQYSYGFNGKENDKETVGTGEGTQDYGFRIYNPSLGKFLSIDPLAQKYPFKTPYDFAENTPIWGSDLDGLELNINPYKLLLQSANTLHNKLEQANTIAKITKDYQLQVSIGIAKWAVHSMYSLAAMGGEVNPQTVPSGCGGVAPYTMDQKKAMKDANKEPEPFQADGDRIFKGDLSEKTVGALNIAAAFTPFLAEEGAAVAARDMTYWKPASTNITETTRVGQWMTAAEYTDFTSTGIIPRTNVLTKGAAGFEKQALAGDYYVEFDVKTSILFEKDVNLGWSLVKSKNAMFNKLADSKGTPLPKPIGTNIVKIKVKK